MRFDKPDGRLGWCHEVVQRIEHLLELGAGVAGDGKAIYSQLAGRPIINVCDLTQALREGGVTPSQMPIDYVPLDGQKVIANTRSSTALLDAEIPKSQ